MTEILGILGSTVCLLAGLVLTAYAVRPTLLFLGIALMVLAWGLCFFAAQALGKREGRLAERRDRKRKEVSEHEQDLET